MRASYGSLQLLGLKPGGYPFSPRAVFLLIGEACEGGCLFCPQSSGSPEKLSRVTWPEIEEAEVVAAMLKTKIDRVCVQATKSSVTKNEVLRLLKKIGDATIAPVSVSMHVETIEDAGELLEAGAANISMALDTVTEELSQKIKRKPMMQTVDLLIKTASYYPGQVTTHLIAGLGETQEELVELARVLIRANVCVSLFAFTPIPGTPLENIKQPELTIYRQIQAALALIRKDHDWKIIYSHGCIISLGDYKPHIRQSDFQNPGCRGCNRPYYNEKPGGIIYNHPNPPDMEQIIKEIGL